MQFNGWEVAPGPRGRPSPNHPLPDTTDMFFGCTGALVWPNSRGGEAGHGRGDPALLSVGFQDGVDRAAEDAAPGDDDVGRGGELLDGEPPGRERMTGRTTVRSRPRPTPTCGSAARSPSCWARRSWCE